ncbi:hypothetical protein R1sor_002436 [Riccia sorocarpa]|uniref:MULE transposase domain-containing protein n=1 Tax=Riccia sorocarpa TaxID=122646 RepID=A0ABD3H2S6_9MARC
MQQRGVWGKARYDAAAMVRAVNEEEEEAEEEEFFNVCYEGEDEEGCKGSKKPQQQAQRCEWRVRCTMGKCNGDIKITTLNLNYTCPSHLHMWRGPLSKAPWLVEVFGDKVVSDSPEPFGQLQSGLIDWDTFENSYTFKRAFICPLTIRGILRYCQKVVALDACFTKNKNYPTQLFLATVIDENSQVVPLAYAVAPVENYENWRWFLHNLHISIQRLRSEAVMIVSDRQKSLERAVTKILPCNPHMH